MRNKYHKKNKEKIRKEARKRYQNLSEEEKKKRDNMLVSDTENFLNKKKERSVNMVVNDIRIF